MLMSYLLNALIIAVAFTVLWLIAGGSLATAFVVYMMSGVLSIAAMASVTALKVLNPPN